jgi:uncharacterized membrane protein YgcG
MRHFLVGLLFLSGMPICIFLLPTAWWPWSLLLWFIGFVALEGAVRTVGARWRGRPLPAGAAGVAIGVAIAWTEASDSGGDGGDGGDGGGGGD